MDQLFLGLIFSGRLFRECFSADYNFGLIYVNIVVVDVLFLLALIVTLTDDPHPMALFMFPAH